MSTWFSGQFSKQKMAAGTVDEDFYLYGDQGKLWLFT
jgi:hypothetical protein